MIFFLVVIPRAACISRIKKYDEGFYQYRIYRLSPTDPVGLYQVEFCPSRKWIHIQSNIYEHKRESSWNPNSKMADPDWPKHDRARRLCYRPVVFFHYFRFIEPLCKQGKNSTHLKKNVTISVSLFFQNS